MAHSAATTKTLRASIEELRVLCPTQYPVVVRRAQLAKEDFGEAQFITKGRRHFKIRLNSRLSIDFLIWVLIHEWAHCMTWEVTHKRHDDHGAFFGIAYSEAYKAVYL